MRFTPKCSKISLSLASGLLLILLAQSAEASPIRFQSAERQATLLELYVSEGCSSCPPAETFISRFKDAPGLWNETVPVVFHVDYWDYLGWRDQWSNRTFTERQRTYSRLFQSNQIYTPEFIRNGREWRIGQAGDEPFANSSDKGGVLRVESGNGLDWKVFYKPVSSAGGDFEIHAVFLGNSIRSDVRSGENRGRQLIHDFVALDMVNTSLKKDEDERSAVVEFQKNTLLKTDTPAVAFWVARAGEITPIQAVGGWVPHR